MRFWKSEFCEKWDFENVNFVKNGILKMRIFGWIVDFSPSVGKQELDFYFIMKVWDKRMIDVSFLLQAWLFRKPLVNLGPMKTYVVL